MLKTSLFKMLVFDCRICPIDWLRIAQTAFYCDVLMLEVSSINADCHSRLDMKQVYVKDGLLDWF